MAAIASGVRQETVMPYYVPQKQAHSLVSPPRASPPPPPRGKKRPCSSSSGGLSKLEKCKDQAQQRRVTQKGLMDELASLLPFPREVTSQMDSKTVLRVAVCFLRMKSLLSETGETVSPTATASCTTTSSWPPANTESCQSHAVTTWNRDTPWNGLGIRKTGVGILQDLMIEALNGFLMVISCDGTILYLSETVFAHTGLFQSEHTGRSVYNLIHEEDHSEVREALAAAEAASLSSGVTPCSFFCRMRSKKKNAHLKAPGYKLVYVSGHCKVHLLEPYVACTVHIVSAPSILEIRAEGNAFITRHNMEMKIIFYDERLRDVLGYSKKDLIGQSLFSLHHHEDLTITQSCSHKVREKGEAVTGYYRLLTRHGSYVWLQTRATMVVDRRTGKPSQLLCMHFVIEKSKGEHSLTLRNMLMDSSADSCTVAMDPVPVPREDGECVNPLPHSDHAHSHTQKPIGNGIIPSTAHFTSPMANVHIVETSNNRSPNAVTSREQWSQHEKSGDGGGTAMECLDELDPSSLLDNEYLPQSIESHSSGIPLITLPTHNLLQSLMPSAPLSISPSSSSAWYPPLSLSPSSSASEMGCSNYSTPVISPHWPEETASFSYSHSNLKSNPHSVLGSSPQSIPHSESGQVSLDAILQDLLETSGDEKTPSTLAHRETPTISPDSGCTELENYLFSLTDGSPQPFVPSHSPVGSSATPSPHGCPNIVQSGPSLGTNSGSPSARGCFNATHSGPNLVSLSHNGPNIGHCGSSPSQSRPSGSGHNDTLLSLLSA